MCEHGNTTQVNVKVMADLSATGKIRWKAAQIDSCIAPIVNALQEGGIDMRGSCCGHNEVSGQIALQDGRLLVALNKEDAADFLSGDLEILYNRIEKGMT